MEERIVELGENKEFFMKRLARLRVGMLDKNLLKGVRVDLTEMALSDYISLKHINKKLDELIPLKKLKEDEENERKDIED